MSKSHKPIADSDSWMIKSIELYTDERKIEFLLNNAIDDADYARALKQAEQIRSQTRPVANRIDESSY